MSIRAGISAARHTPVKNNGARKYAGLRMKRRMDTGAQRIAKELKVRTPRAQGCSRLTCDDANHVLIPTGNSKIPVMT